jgi:protein-arginine kinase activator protein McsA
MLRLQAELKGAITAENYERAAVLRDQIKELENA